MNHKDYIKEHGIDISKPDPRFELADLITQARLFAGITQEELARRMGTKQPSVARAESGKIEPSIDFLEKVAKAIGTSLVYPRFEFMKEPKPNPKEV